MESPPDLDSCTTTIPDEMPVMVLPDCHLFPGCLLPLYIFEERYRLMLAHALKTNRMFCIGNRESQDENAPISPHSTAGLVRACVQQEDGTSQLLLLGLRRIRLTGWIKEAPFRIASIETVPTIVHDHAHARLLKARALDLFVRNGVESAQQLRDTLSSNDNAELACDVLSYHFTRCPKLQQKLLAETSLERRFDMLIEALERSHCK